MKKLIVKEFKVEKSDLERSYSTDYKEGDAYSYFYDPESGKYYRPKEGFIVESSESLTDRFVEVKFKQ